MITQERIAELQEYFWDESNDPCTQEWRDNLTEEEEELVNKWDKKWDETFERIMKKIAYGE